MKKGRTVLGSVRSDKVKKIARDLHKKYPGKFTVDFEENKALLASYARIRSKKLKNTIAGYITRLVVSSQSEESSQPGAG